MANSIEVDYVGLSPDHLKVNYIRQTPVSPSVSFILIDFSYASPSVSCQTGVLYFYPPSGEGRIEIRCAPDTTIIGEMSGKAFYGFMTNDLGALCTESVETYQAPAIEREIT